MDNDRVWTFQVDTEKNQRLEKFETLVEGNMVVFPRYKSSGTVETVSFQNLGSESRTRTRYQVRNGHQEIQ